MTSVVAWLALMLSAGTPLYFLVLWLLERRRERQETLELRGQALNALAGDGPGWRDNTCARCGHDLDYHFEEGCMECPSNRRCVAFVRREPTL